jgi:V/A-type H+-transporting ATPase subunit B
MIRPAPVEYSDVRAARGPLLMVGGATGVGWNEGVEIRLGSGEIRHGVVLDSHEDLAVVQVFEGTQGLGRTGARVVFTGSPQRIPVGEGWLGRICNGRGDPIDGGPSVSGDELREIEASPISPASRIPPADPIVTGVSAVDALATLVRGQKLPVFSLGGLPHLDLAIQVAAQARAGAETFRVVFAAMGITNADAGAVQDGLEERAGEGELVLFINTAADPIVERIMTPRVALTVAEHLAFDRGYHVLVVMVDMTNYCEAVREVASARGDVPTRRGYPGYLYSDLSSLYERCGRIRGREGSVTQIPVLTMPAGDITHPVPDVTGYITEGQLVLSAELHAKGIVPPFDTLASLSRLMRRGVGDGRTRADHPEVAAQVHASLAQARGVRELSELLGEDTLSETDRRYLRFADVFEREFLAQRSDESRTLDETLDRAWRALSVLPRRELTMVGPSTLQKHFRDRGASAGPLGSRESEGGD